MIRNENCTVNTIPTHSHGTLSLALFRARSSRWVGSYRFVTPDRVRRQLNWQPLLRIGHNQSFKARSADEMPEEIYGSTRQTGTDDATATSFSLSWLDMANSWLTHDMANSYFQRLLPNLSARRGPGEATLAI